MASKKIQYKLYSSKEEPANSGIQLATTPCRGAVPPGPSNTGAAQSNPGCSRNGSISPGGFGAPPSPGLPRGVSISPSYFAGAKSPRASRGNSLVQGCVGCENETMTFGLSSPTGSDTGMATSAQNYSTPVQLFRCKTLPPGSVPGVPPDAHVYSASPVMAVMPDVSSPRESEIPPDWSLDPRNQERAVTFENMSARHSSVNYGEINTNLPTDSRYPQAMTDDQSTAWSTHGARQTLASLGDLDNQQGQRNSVFDPRASQSYGPGASAVFLDACNFGPSTSTTNLGADQRFGPISQKLREDKNGVTKCSYKNQQCLVEKSVGGTTGLPPNQCHRCFKYEPMCKCPALPLVYPPLFPMVPPPVCFAQGHGCQHCVQCLTKHGGCRFDLDPHYPNVKNILGECCITHGLQGCRKCGKYEGVGCKEEGCACVKNCVPDRDPPPPPPPPPVRQPPQPSLPPPVTPTVIRRDTGYNFSMPVEEDPCAVYDSDIRD